MMSCAASPYLCNYAMQSHLGDHDLVHCLKSCNSIECKKLVSEFLELRRIKAQYLHMADWRSYHDFFSSPSSAFLIAFFVQRGDRPSAAAARQEQSES